MRRRRPRAPSWQFCTRRHHLPRRRRVTGPGNNDTRRGSIAAQNYLIAELRWRWAPPAFDATARQASRPFKQPVRTEWEERDQHPGDHPRQRAPQRIHLRRRALTITSSPPAAPGSGRSTRSATAPPTTPPASRPPSASHAASPRCRRRRAGRWSSRSGTPRRTDSLGLALLTPTIRSCRSPIRRATSTSISRARTPPAQSSQLHVRGRRAERPAPAWARWPRGGGQQHCWTSANCSYIFGQGRSDYVNFGNVMVPTIFWLQRFGPGPAVITRMPTSPRWTPGNRQTRRLRPGGRLGRNTTTLTFFVTRRSCRRRPMPMP